MLFLFVSILMYCSIVFIDVSKMHDYLKFGAERKRFPGIGDSRE